MYSYFHFALSLFLQTVLRFFFRNGTLLLFLFPDGSLRGDFGFELRLLGTIVLNELVQSRRRDIDFVEALQFLGFQRHGFANRGELIHFLNELFGKPRKGLGYFQADTGQLLHDPVNRDTLDPFADLRFARSRHLFRLWIRRGLFLVRLYGDSGEFLLGLRSRPLGSHRCYFRHVSLLRHSKD